MTDKQKQFLLLCVGEQVHFEDIAKQLGEDRNTISQWYNELKEEREEIAKIRTLWKRKKIEVEFLEFYNWYNENNGKCFYCSITEKGIELLNQKEIQKSGKDLTKRISTRGRKLELDRMEPNLNYNNLKNIVFSCYWCNNAKTDTFTSEEFKEVGKVFKQIWENRLKQ